MLRFTWPDTDVCIWVGDLAVLPRKDLTGEMHLEIGNSFQKVCFYTCYERQMPWVALSFLWLWKEEYASNPGTANVLMADISSQVGWIPIPESLPDNKYHIIPQSHHQSSFDGKTKTGVFHVFYLYTAMVVMAESIIQPANFTLSCIFLPTVSQGQGQEKINTL